MSKDLYPLKFKPILKEKIWGGSKLNTFLHKDSDSNQVGESWEISDVEGDFSIVAKGDLQGKTLRSLIEQYQSELVGKSIYEHFQNKFPLLIKFIDAKENLSVQLHPDDVLAKKRHNSFGKTEMWYIMQADEGAKLTVGFNQKITKEEYDKRIDDLSIEEVMDQHIVSEGDSFFINAGRIHAIGGGVLLAEIQQTSDVTYRVYDYNRKDDEGNLRDLHVKESREVLDFETTQDFKLEYDRSATNTPQVVKHHTYFKTEWVKLTKPYSIARTDSFTIIIVVSGSLNFSDGEVEGSLNAGETLLIPAASAEVTLDAESCEILEVYL